MFVGCAGAIHCIWRAGAFTSSLEKRGVEKSRHATQQANKKLTQSIHSVTVVRSIDLSFCVLRVATGVSSLERACFEEVRCAIHPVQIIQTEPDPYVAICKMRRCLCFCCLRGSCCCCRSKMRPFTSLQSLFSGVNCQPTTCQPPIVSRMQSIIGSESRCKRLSEASCNMMIIP